MKKVDAILTADWHIRSDKPVCRTDDFIAAQRKKVQFILRLAEKYDATILIAGDIGHHHQWKNWLLERLLTDIREISGPNIVAAIAGQHDLPQHNLKLLSDSGLGVLIAYGAIKVFSSVTEYPLMGSSGEFTVKGFHFGQEIKAPKIKVLGKRLVAMSHQMVIQNKPLWPGQEAPKAGKLLREFPCYDLILTGDNHKPFVEKYKGRLLVNPGSITRQTADQEKHKPRVYLWNAEANEVEAAYLPIEKGVISREHIDVKEDRNVRISAFVKYIKDGYEVGLSFQKNIEEFFKTNRIRKAIKDKVLEAIDE